MKTDVQIAITILNVIVYSVAGFLAAAVAVGFKAPAIACIGIGVLTASIIMLIGKKRRRK